MSGPGSPDLAAVVAGIAGGARGGEQVEAYASRTRDTSIKVLRGDPQGELTVTLLGWLPDAAL